MFSGWVITLVRCCQIYVLSSKVKFPIVSPTYAFIDYISASQTARKYSNFIRCIHDKRHNTSHAAAGQCCALERCTYCTSNMKPSKISPLAESCGVCRRCAVSWKWARAWKKNEEKNKDSMWHVLYRRMCFSSWDIWLHQLEILYCCCDKCLYSQFTSFCFSLFIGLLPCFLFTPCLFLPFLFIATKTLLAHTHTHTHRCNR